MLYRSGQLVRTGICPDRLLRPSPNFDLDGRPLRSERWGNKKANRFVLVPEEHVHGGEAAKNPKSPTDPRPLRRKKVMLDPPSSDPTSPHQHPALCHPGKRGTRRKDTIFGKLEDRDLSRVQVGLGPDPRAQLRWERKMAVREIRKRGRVPAKVQIKRTERESLSKSHWIKTSLKKLGPLARQIAGKNIDEAILQMRFSDKKAAKDVREHLEHAKNVAIVRAGMGLGAANAEPSKPITVTLKTGERRKIANPTDIYIQQAWVNRGPYGYQMDHRARGQINRMRPPTTGLSVLLKEEKTRIREWEEREAKAQRERRSQLWTQLPDRKISAQNQYYSW
ncbi:hypothetical protein N7497_008138 [Penicillium chrysogenum]|nr:hypothetical protein N7497_008138 [Penicillium chrysogenum]